MRWTGQTALPVGRPCPACCQTGGKHLPSCWLAAA